MGSPGAINLCLGGYDGTVVGLELDTESDGLLALQAHFAQPTHIGAVRAMALDGSALVTGGVDETVRVYDVARRVESGCLFQHSGTVVRCALFPRLALSVRSHRLERCVALHLARARLALSEAPAWAHGADS